MSHHTAIELSDGPLRFINDPEMSEYQAAYIGQLHVVVYGGTGQLSDRALNLGRPGSHTTRQATFTADRAAAVASVAAICDAWVVHQLTDAELSEMKMHLSIPDMASADHPPELQVTGRGVPAGPWIVNADAIKDITGITLYRRSIPGADDWMQFQGGTFRDRPSAQQPAPTPTSETKAPETKPMTLMDRLRKRIF